MIPTAITGARALSGLQRDRYRHGERGWATAFKAPSLLQLSPDWVTGSCRGACEIVGNPDLKPETSESFEFGLYYSGEEGWLEGVQASVTTFQNNVDDRISISRTANASRRRATRTMLG
jgi:outer membrane receptor for ferrienterochelin and colicins